MHETGIRILLRKIQLIGAQYDKALLPVYCHSTQHYFRVYLQCRRGKNEADKILPQHACISFKKEIAIEEKGYGPLWAGQLWDNLLAEFVAKEYPNTMTETIAHEAKVPTVGFYSTHQLASTHKLPIPPIGRIILSLKKKGYNASRTHFSGEGIRTDAPVARIMSGMKKLK